MTTHPFIPYARQSISKADQEAVASACAAPFVTRGPLVRQFEEEVAAYCGAAHAVAFNSGTTALQATAFAAEAGPLDRLLVPANTFVASAIGTQRGAQPTFVDIEETTGNLCLDHFSELMEERRSRGNFIAIPVHFAGFPVAMSQLQERIRTPHTIVIEDAAHAIGSHYADGGKVGNCQYSDMTIFSFHPAKTMTCGEGGMVTTNCEKLAEKLRLFRDNGIVRGEAWRYQVEKLTGNHHMNEIEAALGLSQLKRLDQFVVRRLELMERYAMLLEEMESVKMLSGSPLKGVAYHLCVVQIEFEQLGIDRATLMAELKERGIGTQVHYIPLYRHPVFEGHPYLPQNERYYERALTLPLYPDMTDGDVERVCANLSELLKGMSGGEEPLIAPAATSKRGL